MSYSPYHPYEVDRTEDINKYLTKTYTWMAIGLALTFAISLLSSIFLPTLVENPYIILFLLVAEVITVISFSAMLRRAKTSTVLFMFFFYAALTGLSTSYLFLYYTASSLFLCFGATAVSFAIMALLGHTTKRDLSIMGRIFVAALVGLLLITIVGFVIQSTTLEILICCLGLLLFLGITAYDSQRLRITIEQSMGDEDYLNRECIYSALRFYLDFINIFFYLIRFMGRRK